MRRDAPSAFVNASLLLGLALAACAPPRAEPGSGRGPEVDSLTGAVALSQVRPGPSSPGQFSTWIAGERSWRTNTRSSIGYTDTEYRRPELAWSQKAFTEALVMIEDRYLYDPATRSWTVSRFLDDLNARYGGVDQVMLWTAYPNIGIDERNQLDFLRSVPGGVMGLKDLVSQFHARGVRVLLPYSPWDMATRREVGTDQDNMLRFCKETGADGVFGDVMEGMDRSWVDAYVRAAHPIALEPEMGMSTYAHVIHDIQSWNYATAGTIPWVSAHKWLEPRHMVHTNARRWNIDRNGDMMQAFFNGTGYNAWENVWSMWNQITPRDGQYLKVTTKILRRYHALTTSANWEPHTPVRQANVYASRFPGTDQTLWTFVNQNAATVTGAQIDVPHDPASRYFDLYHGVELTPAISGTTATLSFAIEGKGPGALLMIKSASIPADQAAFLNEMKALTAAPLASFADWTTAWALIPQKMTKVSKTAPAPSTPPGMVYVRGHPAYTFSVRGIQVEGNSDSGCDVQMPFEERPYKEHAATLEIPDFYIDQTPVTNAQFKQFMDATAYTPADPTNFLKHWSSGTYPAGWANMPVTYVSIEDARAYAAWAGKRLPNDWEWQYAAQGTDGRIHPWGNTFDATRVPAQGSGAAKVPDDVNAHPSGDNPLGIKDLVGNVWQWTNEYADEHTRGATLRGGSKYAAGGWYFPNTYRLDEHNKYLLMSPGRDRSSMIGFRCVKDRVPTQPGMNAFLTQAYPGTRNDYTGWVGYEFTPTADFTVNALGRPVSGTMKQAHTLRVWNVARRSTVAATTVWPTSPRDANGYAYETLGAPVVLKAGTTYAIASSEFAGGDTWLDLATLSGHSGAATIRQGVWGNGAYPANLYGGAGQGFAAPQFYSSHGTSVTGGSLSGSVVASTAAVNLTSVGTQDWAHWSGYDRKSSGNNRISDFTVVGTAAVATYTNDLRQLSWSDGTPTASGANTHGVFVAGVGNGFAITAPADTSTRTLRVYVGGWISGGALTAWLSDGSAPAYTNASLSGTGQYDGVYTLTYKAASAGQLLTVQWTQASGTGNVTLQGAALQ
jgi:formylglycine-generating enzyme required for sulfatase activity